MIVQVLDKTVNYEGLLSYVARMSTATIDKVNDNPEQLIEKLVSKGHLSVGRFVTITFEIACSRTALAQWTRHKFLDFVVKSQRYVNHSNTRFTIPKFQYLDPLNSTVCQEIIKDSCNEQKEIYKRLLEAGAKKEDARYVLPEATETNFAVISNLQGWTDFINLRDTKKAQWEIAQDARNISIILKQEFTAWFQAIEDSKAQVKQDKDNTKLVTLVTLINNYQEYKSNGQNDTGITCKEEPRHGNMVPTIKDNQVVMVCSFCRHECEFDSDMKKLIKEGSSRPIVCPKCKCSSSLENKEGDMCHV